MQQVFSGHCPICDKDVEFIMKQKNFYRSIVCSGCGSWPAQRALWFALNQAFPDWRNLALHEGSPGDGAVSVKLMKESSNYTASQYVQNLPNGTIVTDNNLPCGKYVVQNLEEQTFEDETFDLVITLEVFEHVMHPLKAISEIARTLKPGGATLMSVPVVRKFEPSRRRARLENGKINHLLDPQYHGNPISTKGALVTVDWGFDIASQMASASGMYFVMQTFNDYNLGILDEYNQILIGYKSALPSLD